MTPGGGKDLFIVSKEKKKPLRPEGGNEAKV